MERHPEADLDELPGVLDRRLEALLLDGLIVVLATAALAYGVGVVLGGGVLAGLGGLFVGVAYVSPVALLAYFVVFEGYYGRTPGKAVRGLVVVNANGGSVGWAGSIVRNLARIIDILPFFYVIGIVVAYVTDENQRVGDLLGDTTVAHAAE